MSGVNNSIMFAVDSFEGRNFSQMPKGDILRIGVNPYNGNVVFLFQDTDNGRMAIKAIFEHIASIVNDLSYVNEEDSSVLDFIDWVIDGSDVVKLGHFEKCPVCHSEPVYDDESHSLSCDCDLFQPFRFESYEQALEVWNFTRNYREAA